jgi:hypothetical protein
MDNFCVIINTVSSCSDLWEICLSQLEKHFPNNKVYIFTDKDDKLFDKYRVIIYDSNLDFRTQYLNCLKSVTESYCLIMNDDYILYDKVNDTEIKNLVDILINDNQISFIRFAKGYNFTEVNYKDKLFFLDLNKPFFYSQTAGIWNTESLLKIHDICPPSGIGRKNNEPQLEVIANDVCRNLNMSGLYHYDNEKKRGLYHYDSNIFPYIASALVSGKWNMSEYRIELTPLLDQFKIDIEKRGII